MPLTNLLKEIEAHRIELDQLPWDLVKPDNYFHTSDVRGKISEAFVYHWLSQCPSIKFDENFPRKVNGYTAQRTGNSGVLVREGKKSVCEYDSLLLVDNRTIIVEVKSLKLGEIEKIEQKIPQAFNIGKEIYPKNNLSMLLFCPAYTNKEVDILRIERGFPNVRCVDLGYKKKQLTEAVKQFYKNSKQRPFPKS